ncbi:hypothetical protein ACFL3F_02090 [Planctomycetota bacterium]
MLELLSSYPDLLPEVYGNMEPSIRLLEGGESATAFFSPVTTPENVTEMHPDSPQLHHISIKASDMTIPPTVKGH